MDAFSGTLGGLALPFGLGIVYLSRFLLRKHIKRTGSELESLDSELEGIHRTYRVLNTVTLLSAVFFVFDLSAKSSVLVRAHVTMNLAGSLSGKSELSILLLVFDGVILILTL